MPFSLREWIDKKFALVERGEEDLDDYQVEAIDFLWQNPFAGLFIDTGLGKTIIVLTLIVRLWLAHPLKTKVLVIAPPRVAAAGWPNEIAAWRHTAFLSHSVIIANDSEPEVKQARKHAYAEACWWNDRKTAASIAGKAATAKLEELRQRRLAKEAVVYTIDIYHVEWLVDQFSTWVPAKRNKHKLVRKIVGWPFSTVVIDESSGFKDYSSNRFKSLYAVRKQGFITRLIELTATPNSEGYMGLFGQIALLDLGKRLTDKITHYRKNYFDPHPVVKFVWNLKEGAKELITEAIADLTLVMQAKDYIEDQDPQFITRKIEMTSEEMEQYKAFEREFVMEIPIGEGETEVIEAKNSAALGQKLLQLASGAVYNGDKLAREIHDHKINDLKELIEELQGSPILIAYWFNSSRARLKKHFPDAQEIDDAGKMVDRWGPWNTGKVKKLLIHPASNGHGLNMQYGPGHDIYLFEFTWSHEMFYQLWRRLQRRGQQKRVRVWMPVVKGTREEGLVKKLWMKEDAQNWFFDQLRKMRKNMLARMRAKQDVI